MGRIYKIPRYTATTIQSPNEPTIGETIETVLERLLTNGTPTGDTNIPLHYTERKDGVLPQFNIRTDKWEVALDAADRIAASYEARELQEDKPAETEEGKEENGKPESV